VPRLRSQRRRPDAAAHASVSEPPRVTARPASPNGDTDGERRAWAFDGTSGRATRSRPAVTRSLARRFALHQTCTYSSSVATPRREGLEFTAIRNSFPTKPSTRLSKATPRSAETTSRKHARRPTVNRNSTPRRENPACWRPGELADQGSGPGGGTRRSGRRYETGRVRNRSSAGAAGGRRGRRGRARMKLTGLTARLEHYEPVSPADEERSRSRSLTATAILRQQRRG
jgi:hypothetical protein